MNDLLSDEAIGKLVLLFVFAAFLLISWIIENAWRNDKRWLIPIFILPITIIGFIYKYWEENKAKVFFIGLYIVTMILVGGVTGYNFLTNVARIIFDASIWPYTLFTFLYNHFA